MQISIRKLNVDEWQKLREIRLKGLQTDPTSFSSSYEDVFVYSEERWKNYISNGLSINLVAEADNKIIGLVAAYWLPMAKLSHFAEIGPIYVLPEYRGNKVGSQLLKSIMEELEKQSNIIKVILEVNAENTPAVNLYQKSGFTPVGIFKKMLRVDNNYYDVIRMEQFIKII